MKNRINKYINLQHQQEDESQRGSSSPSSSLDFFEFLYDPEETYSMSHAEDIIFCGKLLPKDHYKIQRPNDQQSDGDGKNSTSISSRRYLPEDQTNTSSTSSSESVNPSKAVIRNSRSFDNNKPKPHHRSPKSKVSDVRHQHQRFTKTSMNKSREESVDNKNNNSKPSWHNFIVFGGLLKVSPPEIDIRDMKNRQSRLRSSTFLPGKVAGGSKRRSNDLLTVLSCKSHSSVGFEEPASVIVRRPTSAVR